MDTTVAVQCPIKGYEDVLITFDMMRSEDEYNAWANSMGKENGSLIVVAVDNWPHDGIDPFGPKAPMGFRMWAVKAGFQDASVVFLTEMMTNSTDSSPHTNGAS